MMQMPVEQRALAFANAQAAPHAPQLPTVSSDVSQPLAAFPSQLAKPGLQLMSVQVPVEQEALALFSEHWVPQEPQLLLVLSGVSQPLAAKPSQSPNPGAQASLHVPRSQKPPVTLVPSIGQTVSQLPQLFALLWRLTQAAPQ
jgi:hypothetical protein